ncbi:MAG: tyrosine--tRNA ligase [Kiloniellales bacterium]
MFKPRSDILRIFQERGYFHQCTDLEGLDNFAHKGRVTAYVGYDATADSLHVGSLVSIMMLHWLQKAGHRPIVLMGGGTTKVGDPSGKDETRQLLSEERIAANIAAIQRNFTRFLDFEAKDGAILANNADWLDELRYVPLLRDIGRHFTINRMLTFDSVKLRLEREQPLTFLEFNYMVLQAYDFLELSRRYDCNLQMGGSDQWGNIVNGVDLARRIDQKTLYGYTTPLITTSAGMKMGKTATGAIWLSEDRLSGFEYYQYWRNAPDADVGRFLRLFTELPLAEIARLEKLEGQEINEAKKTLAFEATRLCRGDKAAESAAGTARQTFEQGAHGEGLPTLEVPRARLDAGVPAYQLLREAGLTASNGEARRLIKGGGARINDTAIESEDRAIDLADLSDDGLIKLSAGKKRHALVRAI